jgi:type VI secretion system protein ImpA
LPGFRDGLLLIQGLIEKYWDSVHPQLDPDDNNDPLERVNIISSLTTPMGTFGDPLQFLKRLRLAPLSDSSQMGVIRMVDVERAASGVVVEGEPTLSASQIQGGLTGTPPDKLQFVYEAVIASEVAVKDLDNLFTKAVGSSKAVAFDALSGTLKEMQKALAPYASKTAGPADAGAAAGSAEGEAGAAGGTAVQGISGAIRSREDVTRVLDQICEFFARTEPSSPVPLLLQRARRLVNLNFVELLNDLSPDGLSQLKVIAGLKDPE